MHDSLSRYSLIAIGAISTVFLFISPSWSADWAISPRVEVIEEYNDNILFYREGEELDDFVTYVKPEVEAKYRTERFRLSLDSALSCEEYHDYDKYDTIDHNHRMVLSYALSRTLSLKTGGFFREDTTLETELDEEGQLIRDREDRRRFGGNLGFDYAFSTRVSLSGGWTRQNTEYPDDPDDLDDRFSDIIDLAPRYSLSPQTSLFINMVYVNTEYDDELDTSIVNYEVVPSFRHDFAEDFYVSGGAGYRYTEYEYKNVNIDEDTDGFVFNLLFHKDWKKVSMELLASRDQYSTIYKSSLERDRVTLRGTWRLSARCRTSLAATFRRNSEDERLSGTDYDSDYFTVSPALSYDFTPAITLTGSADYANYRYTEHSDLDRDRFKARLLLNLRWPRLWSGK